MMLMMNVMYNVGEKCLIISNIIKSEILLNYIQFLTICS